jgi:hypothetical protein
MFFALGCVLAVLSADPPPPPAAVTSTAADRVGVWVTVYNDGRGLVRENRRVTLPAGVSRVRFAGVAEKIQPETVHVSALDGGRLAVLEQNYEYDLLTPQKMLEKFVGETVTLVTRDDADAPAPREVAARLLSTNGGTLWEIDGRIVSNPGYSSIVFPAMPPDLVARPTLAWIVDAGSSSPRTLEATYLTAGMNWRADYVLSLDADEARGGLLGWVTVDNQSGAAYEEAGLQLVAGNLRRAPAERGGANAPDYLAMARTTESAATVARETLFEYHLYTLPRPTTLKANQTKQVRLLEAPSFAVAKEYRMYGAAGYYREDWTRRAIPRQNVAVVVTFTNSEAVGLGIPLPRGVVRVYKRDSAGRPQFVGENRIDHTARNEDLSIDVGDAFDIAAERRQTDFKRYPVAPYEWESAFEIRVRNHKPTPVIVRVVEPMLGDWTLVESSHPAKKISAFEAEYQLPVAPEGETVLTYRARYR